MGRCPACGHPFTTADPATAISPPPDSWSTGKPVHQSHTTDPRSGFYGCAR